MSELPRRHSAHGPRSRTRLCRRTPRSAFPSWAIRFEVETRTTSRVTMDAATDEESVALFVDEILAGTGWEVGAILRYTLHAGGTPMAIYGKVQPGHRGLRTYRIVEGLWQASASYPGLLN